MISDVGKLALLLVVVAGLMVGLIFGSWGETEQAWGLLGLIVGALLQSGTVARRGGVASPMISPRSSPFTAATTDGRVKAADLHRLAADELDQAEAAADEHP